MSRSDLLAMICRDGVALSVRRQGALLGLARSGVYRVAPAPDPEDLALMRRIDALYLELPFYRSRRQHRPGGRSSPPPPSPAGWQRPASRSAWMAAAAGSTTWSSNGCGAR